MELNMFPRTVVRSELEKMVLVHLYLDRPGDEKNREVLAKFTKSTAIPIYAILDPDGKLIKLKQGSTRSEDEFLAFLKEAGGSRLVAR